MSDLSKPYIYLAGPIRDETDYVWRKEFVERFSLRINPLIPSDIITRDMNKLRQFRPAAYMTYRTDLALIDKSDIVFMNLLAHEDGYPARGTLVELGYSIAKQKLIIIVGGEKTREHPFIAFGGDGVYKDLDSACTFLEEYLKVLEGKCTWFKPFESTHGKKQYAST
jgi:nucleoside 2-deoxyribosyltransferase